MGLLLGSLFIFIDLFGDSYAVPHYLDSKSFVLSFELNWSPPNLSFGKVALNILGPLSFSISFRIRLISIRKVPGEDYDFDFMEFIDHLQRIESLTTLSLSINKQSRIFPFI